MKTEFITFTLEQPYFQIKGKTLIILCEEGEIEYEEELLKQSHSVIELIEDEEDFTIENLEALVKKHKPIRIIVEYNGMWNYGAALSLIMLLLIALTSIFGNDEESVQNESGGVI